MKRMAICVLLGSLALPGLAIGQVADSLIGKKVILRSGVNLQGEATTREEDDRASTTRFATDGKLVETYLVEEIDGDRILLKVEKTGETGWLKRKDLIPVDQRMVPFTMAIKRDGSAVTSNRRGLAWHVMGEQSKAIADFDQAIRLNPKGASIYQNRAISLALLGEFEKAITDYNEAIRLDPKHALSYANRGTYKSRKGDFNGAIADCTEAIRLDPKLTIASHCRLQAWIEISHDRN